MSEAKISEAAVEAACHVVYHSYKHCSPGYKAECRAEMRAALAAAIPHLHPQPAELAEQQRDVLANLAAKIASYVDFADTLAATGKQQVGVVQGDAPTEEMDEIHQIAFEIGGDDEGGYQFTAEDLEQFVRTLTARQPGEQEPTAWLIEWESGVTALTKDASEAEAHREYKNCTVVPVYAAPPAQGIDLGQLPDGWSLRTLATCYQLSDGNQVVGNFVGPDAKKNAALVAALIDQREVRDE